MSKKTKFYEMALELLRGTFEEEGIADESVRNMTPDRFLDVLGKIEEEGFLYALDSEVAAALYGDAVDEKRCIDASPVSESISTWHHESIKISGSEKTFEIRFHTGSPVEIRLMRLLPGEDGKNYSSNGKITMARFATDINGELTVKLVCGKYLARISKGSEYTIREDIIEGREGDRLERTYTLSKFADIDYLAGDLHHHSVFSSPAYGGTDDVIEEPLTIRDSMMAMGLSWGALSDHHNVLNHEEWKECRKEDFFPLISKEISTSNGHVMQLGVDKDVIYDIPDDANRTDEVLRNEFKRVTAEIKKEGGLPQLNHPCDRQKSISWNPNFYDLINIFETVEIWNGSHPFTTGTTDDNAYHLWQRLLKEGRFIPATCGSDTHNIHADDYHLFFDEMMQVSRFISEDRLKWEKTYPDFCHVLNLIITKICPTYEKWLENSLTTGCVRTYVKVEKEALSKLSYNEAMQKLLGALRAGRSFLTNGPLLFAKICEARGSKKGKAFEITLISNRPLDKLLIMTEDGLYKEVGLDSDKTRRESKEGELPWYDYSMNLEEEINSKYVYFRAMSDYTNQAITNPYSLK